MAILDSISSKLTCYVTDESTDSQEKEMIEYGIYMFFSEVIKITAIIGISSLLGKAKDALMIMSALSLLRSFLGGVHAKTQWGCFFSYSLTLLSIYGFSHFLNHKTALTIIMVSVPICFWLTAKYAPEDNEFKPILSDKMRKRYRSCSLVLVAIYYISVIFIPYPLNSYIGFSVIAEIVLILPVTYKLYNIKYGKDVLL